MENALELLNEVMNRKMKERNFVSHSKCNDNEIYDNQEIANGFNDLLLILALGWQMILLVQKINMYFNISVYNTCTLL